MRTATFSAKSLITTTVWLLLTPFCLVSQLVEKINVPVTENGDTLAYAFAGGLDAPQFSKADLNRDGIQDLFVFDRAGNVALPFIHSGNPGTLEYTIDWSTLDNLPSISLWALMRDFNGDGVEDIFASTLHPGVQGIDLYRGSVVDGKLAFERMLFDDALGQFDLLYIKLQNSFTPMYSAWGDVPAIKDVDGDGDLDILTFEPGGSYVHYFRNTALEEGLGLDTVAYLWADICWGKFFESDFSEEVKLSTNPNQCATSGGIPAPRHSGSALAAYDPDLDGDMDLVVGDLASPNLVQLINGGDSEKAFITSQKTMFPAPEPADIEYFVAPFILDIDNDGLEDLVAASNDHRFSENYDVAWYYKNTGSQGAPEYTLMQTDLFVDEMLDFGWISKPAVMDVDGDALLDILVGTAGYYVPGGDTDARLIFLRNTGTATEPSFEIADTDFLDFSAFNSIPTWEFAPAAGDLDGDGDVDLIAGERNGGLIYAENVAGPGAPPEFAALAYPYANINVGGFSTPDIVDFNADGLADLVVGERIGNNDNAGKCSNLNYFQNVGAEGDPQFIADPAQAPNTQCLGRVIFTNQPGLAEFSSPEFYRTDGGLRMMTGSETGPLRVYTDVAGNTDGSFTLDNMQFGGIRDGYRTVPELADIDDDGLYELILGNGRGGLTLYNTDIAEVKTSVEDQPNVSSRISVFPNPASDVIYATHFEGYIERMVATDILGRRYELRREDARAFRVSGLPAGTYLVTIFSDTAQATSLVVVGF